MLHFQRCQYALADEYIEVSEEMASALRSDRRYKERHYGRCKRNKANYSLDTGDVTENHVVEFEASAQELVEERYAS